MRFLNETYKIKIYFRNTRDRAPIDFAIQADSVDSVKFLRPMLTQTNKQGETLLHVAAKHDSLGVLRHLVTECKFSASVKDQAGQTPLHYAAREGRLKASRLLVEEYKVSLADKDNDDAIPLHLSMVTGYEEIADYFIKKHGKESQDLVDKKGRNFFHYAVLHSSARLIEDFSKNGWIDENVKDAEGNTSLHLAVQMGDFFFFLLLIEDYKLDFKIKNKKGENLLHVAIGCLDSNEERLKIAKYCVETLKIDIDSKDKEGMTVLHRAAKAGRVQTVHVLMQEFKPDLMMKDPEGRTAVDIAKEFKQDEIVEILQPSRKRKLQGGEGQGSAKRAKHSVAGSISRERGYQVAAGAIEQPDEEKSELKKNARHISPSSTCGGRG